MAKGERSVGPPMGPGGDGAPGEGGGAGTDAGSSAPPLPPRKAKPARQIVGVKPTIADDPENSQRVALVDGRDVYSVAISRRLNRPDFERLVVFGAACLGLDLAGLDAQARRIRLEYAIFEEIPEKKKGL